MPSPRSIQVFLPEGEPRGIRIASIENRGTKAVAFPRSKSAHAFQRDELGWVGVYFLFGTKVGADRMSVYIGEAECCSDGLSTHNGDQAKDFWQTGVVVVSGLQSFTKAHVKMLEWASIRKAKDAGRYVVENSNAGQQPHLPEATAAVVSEILEGLEVLLGCLGFPIFDAIASSADGSADQTEGTHLFWIKRKGYAARAVYNEDGLVVLKDSEARPDVVQSSRDLEPDRERLVKQGVLEKRADKYVFLRDHVFSAPSSAAEMICGGAINGWDAWVDDQGRTLSEIYRPLKVNGAAASA
ncbi:MAG: GIY-YIG nuclease family protein [Phycisphaerales bacterium]